MVYTWPSNPGFIWQMKYSFHMFLPLKPCFHILMQLSIYPLKDLKICLFHFPCHKSYSASTKSWQPSTQQKIVIKHSTKVPFSWTIRHHLLLDLLAELLKKRIESMRSSTPQNGLKSNLTENLDSKYEGSRWCSIDQQKYIPFQLYFLFVSESFDWNSI